jgi:hypothetical protein
MYIFGRIGIYFKGYYIGWKLELIKFDTISENIFPMYAMEVPLNPVQKFEDGNLHAYIHKGSANFALPNFAPLKGFQP